MKKIILMSMLLSAGCMAHAQQRTEAQCLDIARSVLESNARRNNTASTDGKAVTGLSAVYTTDQYVVYGYTNGAPGFVVVSADAAMHEVLGYSKTDRFSKGSLPEGLNETLAMYARRCDNKDLTTSRLKSDKLNASKGAVEPLLGNICFSQDEPYNDKCPVCQGKRCVTGCTAIVMAQIMAYYRYPERMNPNIGNVSYSTSHFPELTWDCSNVFFDWNNISDTYRAPAPNDSVSAMQFSDSHDFSYEGYAEEKGSVYISHLANKTLTTFDGIVQLILTNKEGNIVAFASNEYAIEQLGYGYYYPKYYITPSISSTIPDGDYHLEVVTKANGKAQYSRGMAMGEPTVLSKHGSTFEMCGLELSCGYTPAQADAISTLCASCAYSLHADFGPFSTAGGVWEMDNGLINYMGYSDRMHFFYPENFTPDGWHAMIQNEVQSRRPIYVSGQAHVGYGHAFIIDGYEYTDGVPYYHVNWGWNGLCNGYFILDYLCPEEAGIGGSVVNYGDRIELTVNIKPDDGEDTSSQMTASEIQIGNSSVKVGKDVTVKVKRLFNNTFSVLNARVDVYAIAADGAAYYLDRFMTITDLGFAYSYPELQHDINIPTSIPGGDYTIQLRVQNEGHTDLVPVVCPKPATLHIDNPTAIHQLDAIASPSPSMYDMSGRKASNNTKGIVVVGDKKILKRK